MRLVANPTTPARLEYILEERLKMCTIDIDSDYQTCEEDEESDGEGEDLVTSFYYGDDQVIEITCNCSKKSKCVRSCPCKVANRKCKDCHHEKSNCTNK